MTPRRVVLYAAVGYILACGVILHATNQYDRWRSR